MHQPEAVTPKYVKYDIMKCFSFETFVKSHINTCLVKVMLYAEDSLELNVHSSSEDAVAFVSLGRVHCNCK